MNDDWKVVGALIMSFIAVIVAIALLVGGITNNVATLTTKVDVTGISFTAPAFGAVKVIDNNVQAVTNFVAVNATSGAGISATNYTITNYVITNGNTLAVLNMSANSKFAGQPWTLNYTYEPLGYATDAGSRSIAGFIIVFCALALAVVVLVPTLRNNIVDFIR